MTEIMHGLDEQSVELQADKQTTGAQYVDKDQMVLQFKQAAERSEGVGGGHHG